MTASVTPLPVMVRVGEPVPPISSVATVTELVTVTVYVPARSITTLSLTVGTSPVLQLLPTFQFPPLALVHETIPEAAVISNAVLVSGSNPVAVVTSVKSTPDRSRLRSVNCATPPTAATVVVPLSVAEPLGSLPIARVTSPV